MTKTKFKCVFINRYCKGITETEEKELRIFAESRKRESLGKGIVAKFVSNAQSSSACAGVNTNEYLRFYSFILSFHKHKICLTFDFILSII